MQHIYLSEQKVVASPQPGDTFRYRGEASGPHDDPQGFKRNMRAKGHDVIIVDKVVGAATPASKGVVIATREQLEAS